ARLQNALSSIEAAVRGYVLIDARAFLKDKDLGIVRLKHETDVLIKLVADNPQQEARAFALKRQSQEIIEWYAVTIKVFDAGDQAAAIDRLKSLGGKHRIDKLRSTLDVFVNTERFLSEERRQAAQEARQTVYDSIKLGMLLNLLISISLAAGVGLNL